MGNIYYGFALPGTKALSLLATLGGFYGVGQVLQFLTCWLNFQAHGYLVRHFSLLKENYHKMLFPRRAIGGQPLIGGI
jgi:hypothetical protein